MILRHLTTSHVLSYGKDPQRAMEHAVAAGDLIRYYYIHCDDWALRQHAAAVTGEEAPWPIWC